MYKKKFIILSFIGASTLFACETPEKSTYEKMEDECSNFCKPHLQKLHNGGGELYASDNHTHGTLSSYELPNPDKYLFCMSRCFKLKRENINFRLPNSK